MTRQHFRASSLYIDASNLEHTILRSWTGKAHRESFRIGVVHSQNKPLREWKLQGKQTGLRAEKYMKIQASTPKLRPIAIPTAAKNMWQQNPLAAIRRFKPTASSCLTSHQLTLRTPWGGWGP